MISRSKLRRWHIWLAWIAAIPLLFWTVSGLVMVARPIEEVRGDEPEMAAKLKIEERELEVGGAN